MVFVDVHMHRITVTLFSSHFTLAVNTLWRETLEGSNIGEFCKKNQSICQFLIIMFYQILNIYHKGTCPLIMNSTEKQEQLSVEPSDIATHLAWEHMEIAYTELWHRC